MALARQLDQAFGDVALHGGGTPAALSGGFQADAGAGKFQHGVVDQGVVQDDVGLADGVQRVQRQQARIAGTGAGQPYLAGAEQWAGRGLGSALGWSSCAIPMRNGQRSGRTDGHGACRTQAPVAARLDHGDLRRGREPGCLSGAADRRISRSGGGALPGGARPAFALAFTELGTDFARAGVVKDAGDDPDVTHGALVVATVRLGTPGSGVVFQAGEGVGVVTRPGLPLAVGEPAINPVPREMIRTAIAEVPAAGDVVVEISIPGGEKIAERTLNGRLGIVGGLSILGTTGVVVPYSCSAWIHSIYRGIDVARAAGLEHVAGATGATSEAAVAAAVWAAGDRR